MADESRRDNPRARKTAALFGRTPTQYEGVAEASRVHTRGADPDTRLSRWMPIGPRNVGGAVRSIAQHPQRSTELLAGTAMGGLWKTTNDGYTWRPIATDDLAGGVASISYATTDPRTIYVGSGELPYFYPGGIGFFRSTDGGERFERLVDGAGTNPGSAAHYGRIAVDPRDATRAWIAANNGLWRLEGNTFNAEAIPAPAAGNAVTDVAVMPDPVNVNQYFIIAGIDTVGIARGIYNRR